MDQIGGWIVGLVLLLYFATSPNWGTDEHTVYELVCSDNDTTVEDCPKEKLFTRQETYFAIPEAQVILTQSGYFLFEYQDCKVINAENWECDDGKDRQGLPIYNVHMEDGKFKQYPISSEAIIVDNNSQTISRINYILRGIVQFFRALSDS
jgi:hypothetical protein